MCWLRSQPTSRCAITGASAEQLWKVGEILSVDRIDNAVGYIEGNCQLMARSLNSAKGSQPRVPQHAINRLLTKLSRYG